MKNTEKMDKRDNSRNATSDKFNEKIDNRIKENIRQLSHNLESNEVGRHIEELEKEWDIDRTLMANASTLSLAGVVLGSTVNRNWFILPGVVASFLLWHAIQGWCPPLPIFRKFGYRSRKEIDIEKFALKALRGDFQTLDKQETLSKEFLAEKAFDAARK
ncbi:MAG: hypothetical protein WD426_00440 [Anditalea sp.]